MFILSVSGFYKSYYLVPLQLIHILRENNTKTYNYPKLLDLQVNLSDFTQYLIQYRLIKVFRRIHFAGPIA